VSGQNTLTGPITFATAGIYNLQSDVGKLTITSDISCGAGSGSSTLQLFGSATAEISGVIGGDGVIGVSKYDSGTWILSGINTYSGPTIVSAGALLVNGSIDTAGCTVTGGTLGGIGQITGPVTIQPGGTLSPGPSIGTLTIYGSATLSGTTLMEITHTSPANDRLNVSDALIFGGALIVSNVGPTLAAGDSFTLFSAGSLGGSFASLTLPSLSPRLRWDTSELAASGTITVSSISSPAIVSLLTTGTNLVLHFSTEPNVKYVLESTTNLNSPVIWVPQQTNQGDGTVASISVTVGPNPPRKFFRLTAY
jgi:autotransporter-associated beta strand protein